MYVALHMVEKLPMKKYWTVFYSMGLLMHHDLKIYYSPFLFLKDLSFSLPTLNVSRSLGSGWGPGQEHLPN